MNASLFKTSPQCFKTTEPCFTDEVTEHREDSILNIRYGISGDRNLGAHSPAGLVHSGVENDTNLLTFQSAVVLQRPVLDPCLAVGFLPLPSTGLRVGQLITIKWRVERLKYFQETAVSGDDVSNGILA